MDSILFILNGFLIPIVVYAIVLVLNMLLPGRCVEGYVINPDTKQPLVYRLNGMLVLIVIALIWALISYLGWLPWDWLYQHR